VIIGLSEFKNLVQGIRHPKAARRGALPAGSAHDRRWAGSPASSGQNAAAHDMDFVRASIATGCLKNDSTKQNRTG
jgi:hypothetical protein